VHQFSIEHVTCKGIIPFLFPHGCAAYDGIGSLLPYLKQRMSTLFFIFTLYPPYLLLMYQVQQAIQLLKATKHLCLERDVQRLKHQHPQWSKIDVFKNIMKFKLPPSIPLMPQWHHTQFKELLVMVENFGMLHFFLILTFDETSNLRWKEIEDIENLAMFFNNTFSWKDYLVECVALFCTSLQAFMLTYVLSGENILGIVKHYVPQLELQHRGG